MNIDEILARIELAKGDPDKLAIATLEAVLASRGESELRSSVDAAAIPHWFDAAILACLMETDPQLIGSLFSELCALPMVETFSARRGMNVHHATRMALRAHLLETDPERFHHLSTRAACCFSGDVPHHCIETIYHRLIAEPKQGAEELRQLSSQWDSTGSTKIFKAWLSF